MDDRRRDPDALLLRVQAEDEKKTRGKLKIFFGAAPGVGKTYTMLEAGREQAREGIDVLVGYIEPHVRPETQALVLGLDVLARKEVPYRGTKLVEFDLEAALAKRPQLILVDELAHSNAAGMTHAKRWQDILQLLEAGINVFTTLNVQHLESLRDVIAQITGIVVAETIPDSVFERADEVELVDLPADGLLERMREGKVYVPQQAERAIQSFFKKGNLIALRELALRKAAERVGAEMEDYREEHGVAGAWPVHERLLVCIGPSPFSARLVRTTRRIAGSLKAPWIAVHVETPKDSRLSDKDRQQLSQTLNLVEQLGGETATLSGHNLADELVHYAHNRNVTKIIVGKPSRPRWKEWLQGSLVYELTRKCGDIDVYIITGDPEKKAAAAAGPDQQAWITPAYVASLLMVLACSLVSWPLSYSLAPTNLIMVYLLGVVIVATRFGRGPSVVASLLSVAAFDFFFIPPMFTFAIQDTQYLFTFAVMLGTALTISTLTTQVAFQAESARKRERRTASLYAISHQLAAARTPEQITQAAVRHVADAVDAKVAILLDRLGDGQLANLRVETEGFDPGSHDEAVAKWVFDHGETAGHGTTTLPGSAGLYLPLVASHGAVGVLGVLPNRSWRPIEPERLHLLETLAGLIALAVERVQLAAEAARIRVQMETEKLRSSLLSAVSHDLRTPLSVITGAASTLLDSVDHMEPQLRRELLESMVKEAGHLNRLVANLLDMTRLEAGVVELHKEWQSIEEIVGAAIGRTSPQWKDHSIVTHLQGDLPFVPMDDLLIEQLLSNLLENAAKYSPPGTPIDVTSFANDTILTVEIADRGPGLSRTDLDRVFEKFYRAGNAGGRPGAGLGLAICRGIVELHGGQIEAENRPGGGSVFRFTLPLAATQPEIPRQRHKRKTDELDLAMMANPKILIVEDEEEIRRFLRASLANHGYRLIESRTGQGGLDLVADEQPDLVLLDLGLPDTDGLTVIRRLRGWSQVPVIVLSARGQEADKVNALDAGADDYLTKPFSVVELLAHIRVAIRHVTQGQDEAGQPIFTLGSLRVDLEGRHVLVGEKEVHLTPIEYRILTTLIKYSGKVVTHRQLLKEVWGPESVFETHYLRVYMTHLRRKIELDPAQPQFVLTDPGIGYRLAT